MTRGNGLEARVKRLEGADASSCPVCNGNPIRLKWVGVAAEGLGGQSSTNADDYPPEVCAGCARPFKLCLVHWRTDADAEASR